MTLSPDQMHTVIKAFLYVFPWMQNDSTPFDKKVYKICTKIGFNTIKISHSILKISLNCFRSVTSQDMNAHSQKSI